MPHYLVKSHLVRHSIALKILGLFYYRHAKIIRPDRIAFEYDIFGDFKSDLVVGYSVTHSYCFIEFEDATANSTESPKPGKALQNGRPGSILDILNLQCVASCTCPAFPSDLR